MSLFWTVNKVKSDYDGTFPWQLKAHRLPLNCPDLQFEQFVKGSYELTFTDGSTLRIYATEDIKKINPRARVFGDWIEDLIAQMKCGPKLVTSYYYARCKPGIFGRTTTALRFASPGVGGGMYHFEDEPGFQSKFGEEVKYYKLSKRTPKRLKGVSWFLSFNHKLWLKGVKLGEVVFDLRGEYSVRLASQHQQQVITTDTRKITSLKTL